MGGGTGTFCPKLQALLKSTDLAHNTAELTILKKKNAKAHVINVYSVYNLSSVVTPPLTLFVKYYM